MDFKKHKLNIGIGIALILYAWYWIVSNELRISNAEKLDRLDELNLQLDSINELITRELKKQRTCNGVIAESVPRVQEAEQEKILIRNEMLQETNLIK